MNFEGYTEIQSLLNCFEQLGICKKNEDQDEENQLLYHFNLEPHMEISSDVINTIENVCECEVKIITYKDDTPILMLKYQKKGKDA